MIKKFFVLLIGLFLIVPIWAQGTADNAETVVEPIAYINAVEGEAFFRNFEKVELNIIVQEGEEINTTADGRVEILLKGNGVIRLDRNTRIVFAVLTDQMIVLEAWNGNIYVEKGELEIGIKSPNRSLNLSQSEWYFTEPEKSFKKWNNARNEELTPDEQYLPKELGRYGNTLNHYGYWRHISSYGYCWIPRVAYSWSPYLYGRWDWYRSHRMWISYDPFGWCTHHYGRWHWHSTWGCWYWIPTRYWGPAWVLWSILSDCIGWSPLWYGGYDSYYYRHYYRDYYGYSYSKAWTFIHRDQLQSRNVTKHVIHKNELKRKIPGSISSNNLKTSLSTVSTRSISKSTARISPKSTMNRSQSIQNQTRQRIQSRQVRSKITNTYSSRTRITTQRQKISKSRVTPSATSVRASYRSRSSKIISRPSARKSFSSRASISSSRKLSIFRSSKSMPRSSSRSTQSRKVVKKK